MTPERWQALKTIYFKAMERSPIERAAFLDQACGTDQALRSEVADLLTAESRQPSILDATPEQLIRLIEPTSPLPPSRVGEAVGPYHIVRTLGEGGMGTVYLAERDDIDKQVALKVVRGSRAAGDVVDRFLAERRMLARLEHPHIARLLDAGVTEDGTPFFAMEHVADGKALTTYCDDRGLTLETRLSLFSDACDAVRHAHQCLIIHRDLKPSNILVTENAAKQPIVKLVDFGIAKQLVDDPDAIGRTQTGMNVMTPSYAAPEQVRGEVVTTATDIYALGVTLYELLVGRRPYEVRGLRPAELEQRICEVEPVRPSVAARNIEGRPGALRQNPIDPRRLYGDLDSICLQALAKDPGRRYASVDALLDDLRRHAKRLPIRARPPTFGYHAQTFLRRHRWAVATAAVVLSAMILLVAFYTWQLSTERDRVVVSLAESEEVTDFLINLFEANDPDTSQGRDVSAQTLLSRGLTRADALADQPTVQARMLDAIGRVHVKLGQLEAARPPLMRAFDLRRDLLGPNDPTTAVSAVHLGEVLRDLALYDQAEALLRDTLAAFPESDGFVPAHVASLHDELGALLSEQGRHAEAELRHRRALAANRKVLGRDDPAVAMNLNNLAYALHQQGRFAEAETHYREALAINRQANVHTQVAVAMNNLGVLLLDRGERDQSRADFEAAETMFEGVLEVRRQLLGAEHPRIATTLNNLATLLRRLGRVDEAIATHRRALAMRQNLLGDEHPLVALSHHNLGTTLTSVGAHDEAAAHLEAAIAIRIGNFGAEHPSTANTQVKLAELALETGDYDRAAALFDTAHAVFEVTLPADDLRVCRVAEGRARLDALGHRSTSAGTSPSRQSTHPEPPR